MLLQGQALKTGYDAKGLYVWSTPAQLGLLTVCAVFAAVLVGLTMRRSTQVQKYRDFFPECWVRGGCMVLAGVMLLLSVIYALTPVPAAIRILGVAAAGCMAAGGIFLASGYHPPFGIHGIVCVYFVVRLLMNYRSWGASTHLERYAFLLLADVMLMLYSFHRCAADAGIYARRRMLLTGFGAMFCSLAAMANDPDPVFYVMAVIWVAGSMCTLDSN